MSKEQMLREALESAIEVAEEIAKKSNSDDLWTHVAVLKEALDAKPAEEAQPVAAYLHHISDNADVEFFVVDFNKTHPLSVDGGDHALTYLSGTHPAHELVRKLPRLTDEEIDAAFSEADKWCMNDRKFCVHFGNAIMDAMEAKIKEQQGTTMKASTLYAIDQMRVLLRDMDFAHRQEKGRFSLDEIASCLKSLYMLKLSIEAGGLDHCFTERKDLGELM